jgi:hypothetical protein
LFQITNTLHLSDIVGFEVSMRCEYDKCNSMDILDEAKLIADKEYNISSLFEALGYETEEAEQTSSTKLLISSTTQTQQSSSSSTTSAHRNDSTTTNPGTTTPKSTGQHVRSTNAMIYLALLIFMSHLIVHPFI